jgi:hypothetical protein
MVKQGPVPAFLHGLYEYLGGGLLIALPFLIDYDSGAATAVSIVLGVLVIFLAATTDSTMSLVDQISLPAHIALDYVLVVILIASPFLFGFSGESAPTAVFIVAGVLHLLVSIGTRYRKEQAPPSEERAVGPASDRDREPATGGDEIPEFELPPRSGEPPSASPGTSP